MALNRNQYEKKMTPSLIKKNISSIKCILVIFLTLLTVQELFYLERLYN